MYDTYGDQQIKIEATGAEYRVGQKVPLTDGIYVSDSAGIVVYDGFFIAQFPLTDKWGNAINCQEVIADSNPPSAAVKDVMRYFEDTE